MMRQAARVNSIDALKHFKHGLTEFSTLAITALGEAQAEIQRTVWWVQHDQLAHWKNQKRKRTVQLAQAKSELFRAQVASPDQRTPATLERNAVDKAQRAIDEAETKIANVKRWSRQLERETTLYKGYCQQLARAVEGDMPRAIVRLERMIDALERYVKLAAPTGPSEAPAGDQRS